MKGFSFPYDPEIHAAARGNGLNISPKAAREVCKAIKGMDLEKAKSYLEEADGDDDLDMLQIEEMMRIRTIQVHSQKTPIPIRWLTTALNQDGKLRISRWTGAISS
ncbi:MAG: hypothetical protein COC13_02345 [Methanobacteriota archaeon]|nr:MAG: hypothetical protein COC13_02345 [Euryarchaeota archaeon]